MKDFLKEVISKLRAKEGEEWETIECLLSRENDMCKAD